MSALSPAPAPTSGVHWINLPTPLESTLPTCCLSYKQRARLSPLCFHGLTNPFHPTPFLSHLSALPPGVSPTPSDSAILAPHWVGELILSIAYSLFFALGSLFRSACRFCFQRLTASFAENGGWVGCREPTKARLTINAGLWESIQCLT